VQDIASVKKRHQSVSASSGWSVLGIVGTSFHERESEGHACQ
jgi:hypothetical protein